MTKPRGLCLVEKSAKLLQKKYTKDQQALERYP
jgi:hypothetical protein